MTESLQGDVSCKVRLGSDAYFICNSSCELQNTVFMALILFCVIMFRHAGFGEGEPLVPLPGPIGYFQY